MNPKVNERFDAAVEDARKKLAKPAALLRSPEGTILLEELEKRFVFGPMLGESPEATYFNLGAREVVLRLRALRDSQGQET